MGVKSIENTDRLYWLGRYSERVYTTLSLYGERFDSMIEEGEEGYDEFCRMLDIPNVYPTADDFRSQYPFGENDPNSIYNNMIRAYNNAIELREEIGSDTLAYIQLAVYEMKKASVSTAPMIEFQKVIDYILAFWGITDDQISDENTRNIIKVGRRVERIDLYGRLHLEHIAMKREYQRLSGRIGKCQIRYRKSALEVLGTLVDQEPMDHRAIVRCIEGILEA